MNLEGRGEEWSYFLELKRRLDSARNAKLENKLTLNSASVVVQLKNKGSII
jgi:hypothetical protein